MTSKTRERDNVAPVALRAVVKRLDAVVDGRVHRHA